jgi:uncharacterized protein (UPF0332 family)
MVAEKAMKGRELIPVAEKLSKGHPPTEPNARSAVSRAYYAAFSEVSDYLRVRHYAPNPKKSQHEGAWNHLRSGIVDSDVERQARRRATADVGFRLKARRHKADYQLASRLARDEAPSAVQEAKRIISELQKLDAAVPP